MLAEECVGAVRMELQYDCSANRPVPSVQALLDGFQSRVIFGSQKKLLKSDGRRKGVNHNGVNVVLNRISRCIVLVVTGLRDRKSTAVLMPRW